MELYHLFERKIDLTQYRYFILISQTVPSMKNVCWNSPLECDLLLVHVPLKSISSHLLILRVLFITSRWLTNPEYMNHFYGKNLACNEVEGLVYNMVLVGYLQTWLNTADNCRNVPRAKIFATSHYCLLLLDISDQLYKKTDERNTKIRNSLDAIRVFSWDIYRWESDKTLWRTFGFGRVALQN